MPGPACAANTPFFLPRLMRLIAVGEADADALLPAEDRADVEGGAALDQRVARIGGEEVRAFAAEDFSDDVCAVHGVSFGWRDRDAGKYR